METSNNKDTISATPLVPELSVVVPVRNEADNIAPLVAEIRQSLNGLAYFEIVYVDDGSIDDTPEKLRDIAAVCECIKIVRHRKSYGQSAAIATGVKASVAPLIITIDGDGQNDPADMPELLASFAKAGDKNLILVTGFRKNRRDTWVKRFSSTIANNVRSSLLGDDTPDTGCGLKVFSRSAFMDMPYFNHMHRFLPALMLRRGGVVVSVEVNHRERQRGTSNYGVMDRLWVGIIDLFGVIWLKRRGCVPEIEPEA